MILIPLSCYILQEKREYPKLHVVTFKYGKHLRLNLYISQMIKSVTSFSELLCTLSITGSKMWFRERGIL